MRVADHEHPAGGGRAASVTWTDDAGDWVGVYGYCLHDPAAFWFTALKQRPYRHEYRDCWNCPPQVGGEDDDDTTWGLSVWRPGPDGGRLHPDAHLPVVPVEDGLREDIRAGLIACGWRGHIPYPLIVRVMENCPPEVLPILTPGAWLDADTLRRAVA